MKIYNEVITIFNDLTGKWETISEDSYEYNGLVALAQGIPPNSLPVAAADTIADTLKTTTGYFTNGDGTINVVDVIQLVSEILSTTFRGAVEWLKVNFPELEVEKRLQKLNNVN